MTTLATETSILEVRTLINGAWKTSSTTSPIPYPYDGRTVGTLHHTSLPDVDAAVKSAHAAFAAWRNTPAFERARLLAELARLMEERVERFATVMTLQTGKTIKESRTEIARSISTIAISAEEAKRIGGEVISMDAVAPGAGKLGFTTRIPMGVVAGISPFNAPLNTICHKLGPALAAGNTFVVKPHPQGSGLAVLLGEACLDAGLPAGVFNVVHGGADVGRALTTHSLVALINFTGSGAVAERIIRAVGLKRVLLELGGNAPTIVCADADLDKAVPQCAEAAFGLTGQSCISTQRIYVERSIYDRFVEQIVAVARGKTTGDPMDPATAVGPMISEDAAIRVEAWIAEAERDGARLLCGGRRVGCSLEPAVLVDVNPSMRVVCEEVFGPIVAIIPFDSLDAALEAANDTPWGLKSGIFTSNLARALKAARVLDYGTVNINAASRARVDHEPSGGIKASGWGKEGPRFAIEEMTYLKMITLAPS
ncbi:MAG: aldehyde dehydrogenase family protein [Vulcanimicrobiaceae bacterium]